MRCSERIKVYFKEAVTITEFNDEMQIITINSERWTYIYQQCPTTTKIKSARCWKRWGICGQHAAKRYPDLYVKSKGSLTGGRTGLTHENPLIIPILFN